jgi:phospho-N-acetylmuramoyl-pentapeptide-transferase
MSLSFAGFILAFALGVLFSRLARRSLSWLRSRERKVGKERIHRLFPKPRRPLGGGLAVLLATTIALLVVPPLWGQALPMAARWMLPLAWAYGLIGLLDDLRKVTGQGMHERTKLLLQALVAFAFGFLLWRYQALHTVAVPFSPQPLDLGPWYIVFAAVVVLATTNAVNLSDGVDGLAGGAAVIALLGIAAVGLLDPAHPTASVAAPLIGAILGFLVYNLPPARLLMGDTGALGIGAALAVLAMFARAEVWLLLFGAPFVVNALSVALQLGAVRGVWRVFRPLRHRTTEPPRPFLCTPLHHHFQWLGWRDWWVLAIFWGLGILLSVWALLSLRSSALFLTGLALEFGCLLAAAAQKVLRANYFLGLLPRAGQPPTLALFRGLPIALAGIPLYRLHHETMVTEAMLGGATAESILWRPISEIEAHVVLGKIYADHKLFDEAVREWEQVPPRNLLLRPSVVLRLARLYYGSDRLLEAIKLWERLPDSRLQEMPNLREVVRSAKLRLTDLASRSYRQSVRLMQAAERKGSPAEQIESYLIAARRFNQDLLSLLLYERDKLRGRSAEPQAARARREVLRQTRSIVLARLQELDAALAAVARTGQGQPNAEGPPPADPEQRAAHELRTDRAELIRLLAPVGDGPPQITRAAVHPKASRNAVLRLYLAWPQRGPATVIAKRYAADRITFFSACYRRERGVLELLHRYGCAVPRVYAGQLRHDQALLLMQDLGDETLAERLEASDDRAKQHWLRSAVNALVSMQATAHRHLAELAEEIAKVDKERLVPDYYLSALRIALERIAEVSGLSLPEADWGRLAEQVGPLVEFLCGRPAGFIHFEMTPHHFLVSDAGLHAFDFEQATIGPLEFDLAALLAQPESELGQEAWDGLVRYYRVCAGESSLPVDTQTDPAVAYAALVKCLVYAGAAANFLGKFGGEHHLQRFHYYLGRSQAILRRWPNLRPFELALGPRLRAARAAAPRRIPASPSA